MSIGIRSVLLVSQLLLVSTAPLFSEVLGPASPCSAGGGLGDFLDFFGGPTGINDSCIVSLKV